MFIRTEKQKEASKLLSSLVKYILLSGGSRSGKTAMFIRALLIRALKARNSRHLIVRQVFNHIKSSIWYDSFPKTLKLSFPDLKYEQNKSDWFIKLPNESQIWFGGLDDKHRTEKILGNEYSTIYFNEVSQMKYESIAMALTRLAQKTNLLNKAYFDCNPPTKSHWVYKLFILLQDPESKRNLDKNLYQWLLMNPYDNRANLPDDYIETTLDNLPERQRQRFKEGKFLDDAIGALWNYTMIKYADLNEIKEDIGKIVVAIDPAVTKNKKSNETGIVVVGKSKTTEFFYVLDDISGKYSPNGWANKALWAYDKWQADCIIGEKNQGGDMIETIVRNIRENIKIKLVTATRGKYVRAEPIAALYEQDKVRHTKRFEILEDQMVTYTPESEDTESPDRMDALVWGITFLESPKKKVIYDFIS